MLADALFQWVESGWDAGSSSRLSWSVGAVRSLLVRVLSDELAAIVHAGVNCAACECVADVSAYLPSICCVERESGLLSVALLEDDAFVGRASTGSVTVLALTRFHDASVTESCKYNNKNTKNK